MKNTCYKTVLKASYAHKIPMPFYTIMLVLKHMLLDVRTHTQKFPNSNTKNLTYIQATIAESFRLGFLSLNIECKWLILLKQQQQIRKQYEAKTNPESEMHHF